MGPPDLYQKPKNNYTIISKMEVLGINKKKSKHSRYFFYKRDHSPDILAVLTSQFLGWCFPKSPPPFSDGDRLLA